MLELILTAHIKDESAYEKLAKDMPDQVKRNEPETTTFRWMREDGGKRALFVDAYTNANAFVQHYRHIRDTGLLERFMSCIELDGVHAYGDLNQEAREILQQSGAAFYDEFAGYARETEAVVR